MTPTALPPEDPLSPVSRYAQMAVDRNREHEGRVGLPSMHDNGQTSRRQVVIYSQNPPPLMKSLTQEPTGNFPQGQSTTDSQALQTRTPHNTEYDHLPPQEGGPSFGNPPRTRVAKDIQGWRNTVVNDTYQRDLRKFPHNQ
jgi:hypothetical protein